MQPETIISHQIKDAITKHLEDLNEHLMLPVKAAGQVPDHILSCVSRLAEIAETPVESATSDMYEELYHCQSELAAFLKLLNQDIGSDFKETLLGEVWARANAWWEAGMQSAQVSVKQVWELLSPVQPDRIEDLGDGVYEARWWTPVPVMDVEILRRTEGVMIHSEPYEPQTLAGGLAVRFSVYNV